MSEVATSEARLERQPPGAEKPDCELETIDAQRARDERDQWYLKLASAMIHFPGANAFELGTILKQPPKWVATIKNSDAFQEYYRKRTKIVAAGIQTKTAAVVEMALDRLAERIELFGDVMPVDQLADIADKGAKRLGFGSAAPPNFTMNVGVTVGRGDLEDARKRMHEKFGVVTEASIAPLIGSTSIPSPSPSAPGSDRREASESPALDGEVLPP